MTYSSPPPASRRLLLQRRVRSVAKLSPDHIIKLLGSCFSAPHWDPEWFVYQYGNTPSAGPTPFGPFVKGVIAGFMADEAALYGMSMGWPKWKPEQFTERVKSVVQDETDARNLLDAYGIDPKSSVETNVRGLIDKVTDTIFTGLPLTVAEQPNTNFSPPVSLYRFDQAEIFAQSPFNGYAYHSLDTGYFCRYPVLAGLQTQPNTKATCDRLNDAVLDFAYGVQLWEPYGTNDKIMVFNGTSSGLAVNDQPNRWRQVFDGERDRDKTVRRYNRLVGFDHDSLP